MMKTKPKTHRPQLHSIINNPTEESLTTLFENNHFLLGLDNEQWVSVFTIIKTKKGTVSYFINFMAKYFVSDLKRPLNYLTEEQTDQVFLKLKENFYSSEDQEVAHILLPQGVVIDEDILAESLLELAEKMFSKKEKLYHLKEEDSIRKLFDDHDVESYEYGNTYQKALVDSQGNFETYVIADNSICEEEILESLIAESHLTPEQMYL